MLLLIDPPLNLRSALTLEIFRFPRPRGSPHTRQPPPLPFPSKKKNTHNPPLSLLFPPTPRLSRRPTTINLYLPSQQQQAKPPRQQKFNQRNEPKKKRKEKNSKKQSKSRRQRERRRKEGNKKKRDQTNRPSPPTSPPSSTGISRPSPLPDAPDPTWTVLPGNLAVTDSSTPEDSVAVLVFARVSYVNVRMIGGFARPGKGGWVGRGVVGEGGGCRKEQGKRTERRIVLEPCPCFAACEFRSRSACWAMARGSRSWYLADMVGGRLDGVVGLEWKGSVEYYGLVL